MTNFNTITIIGASGLVGQEFVKLMNKYNLSDFIIKLISNNYVGQKCTISNIIYESIEMIDFTKPTIFINCANSEQAIFIKTYMSNNSILIDNSSEYRMNKDVPLIVPEINWSDYNGQNIIANPNCSTIILAMLLYPFIKNNNFIKRIVVSTYQSASGAGRDGLEELIKQTKEISQDSNLTTKYWKQQYIHNVFIHDSAIETNYYCNEENKLINETNKIFKTTIGICPTCVRVPVLRSHCESVNIEFFNEISYEEIITLISNETNILELINDNVKHIYPTSLSSQNNHLVQVGHIRQDYSLPKNKGWNFWISGDQLLRGASYNAFIIMLKLLKKIDL
jgi:aspartate-semialdehyde dehydrogenase